MDELAKERYDLAVERIREIREEKTVADPYLDFFTKTAGFLEEMICLRNRVETGEMKKLSLEELRLENIGYYQDILPENYPTSYSSPDYAAKILGEDLGVLLSFLYTELRGMIVYAWEQKEWDFLVGLELFLQVYSEFEGGEVPTRENVRKILYWYVNDYCQEMVEERIRQAVDPALDFAVKIIKGADLTDLRYLYQFGEYVTEEEEKTAAFLNTLPEEEITAMARTYTEGYRIGFIATGKDLSRKKTVNIRYVLGFERMIRAAITQFEQMGLQPVLAHAERYECLYKGRDRVAELKTQGAYIQINCESILGKCGRKAKHFCMKLLKEDQIDLMASDAHDTEYRIVNIREAAELISRKFGQEKVETIFIHIPKKIILT